MGRALETEMHNEDSSVLHQELRLQNPNIKLEKALVEQGCVLLCFKITVRETKPMQNRV